MITYPINTEQEKAASQAKVSLQLSGLGKKYFLRGAYASGDFWALKDVNFEVKEGEMVGIIGRNGAGKTSLLNIISGTLSPTEGKVISRGKVLGLFNLGVGFQDELTGRENIFLSGAILGASKKELNDKLSFIIEFSELGDFIDMPLGSYSQGMRLRLGFSIVTNLDFDILVIDEVIIVGDTLFQNKCFQRLMDFKRKGKSLAITSQSMELVERLCDKVALIDHGKLLFFGNPEEGISKYKLLLNSEKFSISLCPQGEDLVTNTKKWADDPYCWGKRFGTKEVIIESVEFINKFWRRCNQVKSKGALKIKVNFKTINKVKDVHFGVAVFCKDGVYCHGPNTEFDGYKIPELKPGKGWFTLSYKRLLLAPGEYYFSVGIWDKKEALAFDYCYGCYKLTVTGHKNENGGFLSLPFKLNYGILNNASSPAIRISDLRGEEKSILTTNESVRIVLNPSDLNIQNKNQCLSLAILRDDDVCCQVITALMESGKGLNILFPSFALLPGRYKISAGEITYPFQMVFNRKDHGTVYLAHNWGWRYFEK